MKKPLANFIWYYKIALANFLVYEKTFIDIDRSIIMRRKEEKKRSPILTLKTKNVHYVSALTSRLEKVEPLE
jgi:hypothetical protein